MLLIYSAKSFAQQSYGLVVEIEEAEKSVLKKISYPSEVADSLAVYKEAESIISQLQFNGYLLAEIVSLTYHNKQARLVVKPNQLYKWVSLSAGNLPVSAKSSVGFKEKSYQREIFDVNRLQALFASLLNYYENTGYPFANLSLDSILIHADAQISASVKAVPHQRFVFDSIHVVGSGQIAQKYIQSYLNIKQGMPYAEYSVAQVTNRLRELPFLEMVKPVEVSFSNEKALVHLYVNKKQANQFDGIMGLQQNGANNKVQLVGNLRLFLQNAFKRGERLDFNYQGFGQRSQLLDIKVNVPHVLNTDFGISPSIYLYKQDTSFLNVNTKLGFDYLLKGNNTFQFYIENRATSLLAVDAYKSATILPPILDAATIFYGLGLNMEHLDYRYNPQKGYTVNLNFAVGAKKIKRNSAIPEHLYTGVPLSSTSYLLRGGARFYRPLGKQLVLALGNETAFLNGRHLLESEVFRLGGQNSLRGFNELSLLATTYSYGNAELRYLIEQNSFLFLFYNQAYMQYKTAQVNYVDYPLGLGAGINFETNLGVLSISYALGKQKNNPLNLRQGKIHFGIAALF